MLSGVLYPSGGELQVLGYVPHRRAREFLSQITLVMGNRSQLNWDLPALDSFEMLRAIYGLLQTQFRNTRDELIDLMDAEVLVHKPVRNLSLGERMKMEIIGALLHKPRVLFMDEPSVGLDVIMQHRMRKFILEYNKRYGATVLLASHNMSDVEALCKRVIVILLMGAVILYCFWLILSASAFWVIRVGEIVDLFEGVYAAGRWPIRIYPPWLRLSLTFIIPIAFAVTVPSEALTNRLTAQTLLETLGPVVLLLAVSRLMWFVGLRKYSGASA